MMRGADHLLQSRYPVDEELDTEPKTADFSEVYRHLIRSAGTFVQDAMVYPGGRDTISAASEIVDHLTAGFEEIGVSLMYIVQELCHHPKVQQRLRYELSNLAVIDGLPDPRTLDALPLLTSIIYETLRLDTVHAGPQPRIVPPEGCKLEAPNAAEEYEIPAGCRVSAQAYTLHRNADVFEQPHVWLPERWMMADELKLREMRRWFWAFSSGGRMCLGNNLAVHS
jgi:cytochrome P450